MKKSNIIILLAIALSLANCKKEEKTVERPLSEVVGTYYSLRSNGIYINEVPSIIGFDTLKVEQVNDNSVRIVSPNNIFESFVVSDIKFIENEWVEDSYYFRDDDYIFEYSENQDEFGVSLEITYSYDCQCNQTAGKRVVLTDFYKI
jgi:hypothetical protein